MRPARPPGTRAMILDRIPHLATKKIVLASASPRRRELLSQIGIKFEVVVSSFEEDLPKDSVAGSRYAELTATHKALDVARNLPSPPPHLIIGADTVVECGSHILEKPTDADDAKRMLALLSGRTHEVHTGVALLTPPSSTSGKGSDWAVKSFVTSTTVVFDELSGSEIDAYVASGEPFGKAGSYGIQGRAAVFVKKLDGCYFNVMGLPIHQLCKELKGMIENGDLELRSSP